LILVTILSNSSTCPSSIIPGRISLNCTENGVCEAIKNEGQPVTYKWGDNTPLDGRELLFYSMPYEGYNINYRYSINNITYNRIQIDGQGNVIAEKSYLINLAIDPKDKTEAGFRIVDSKCFLK